MGGGQTTETVAANRYSVQSIRPPDPGQHFATNPRAGGKAAGLELIFMGVNFILQWLGGRQAKAALQKQLDALSKRVQQDLKANPQMGVLLRFHYCGGPSHPESIIQPVYRFGYVTYGRGYTISEARRHAERHGSIRSAGNWVAAERWFKPTAATSLLNLAKPYPVIGRGTFVTGKAKLQDVKYGGVQGFDDESEYQLPSLAGGQSYQFDILKPPSSVILIVGSSGGPVKVPLKRKSPGGGGAAVPVVDLDTTLGSVTAAMVFPRDDVTAAAFARAPATAFGANISMRHEVNIGRVRWVRPEYIRRIA
jgi:hypothetical protein